MPSLRGSSLLGIVLAWERRDFSRSSTSIRAGSDRSKLRYEAVVFRLDSLAIRVSLHLLVRRILSYEPREKDWKTENDELVG